MTSPDGPPPQTTRTLRFAGWAWSVVVASVFLVVSPATNVIDDIQVSLLFIGGGFLLVLFCWLWLRGEVALPRRRLIFPLAAWFVAMLVSILSHQLGLIPHPNRHQWIGWIRYREYLALAGVFLLAAGLSAQSRRLGERLLQFWVGMLMLQCAIGLFNRFGGTRFLYLLLYGDNPSQSGLAALLFTYAGDPQLISSVTGLSTFADLIVLWAPLALVGVRAFRRGGWRLLSVIAAAFSIVCFLVWRPETSRFAYLAALVILGSGLHLWIRKSSVGIPHLRVVAVCLAILAATILFFQYDYGQTDVAEFKTNLAKYEVVWEGEFRVFLQHPVLGGGPGSTLILFPGLRSPDYRRTGYITTVTLYPNNLVVWLLAETGVMGTACFLWFLSALFARGFAVVRTEENGQNRLFVLAILSGLAGFLLTTLLHTSIHHPPGAVGFWGMAGPLTGLIENQCEKGR